jgi:leucyl aminopeptidase (aminopeptidase T)
VIDSSVQGWGYTLKKPIRAEVKKGRVQVETVTSEVMEEAERLKRTLLLDENANNFAELGLGISHLTPKALTGAVRDYGVEGTTHIACGRNIDVGGQTWSTVHQDMLMTEATVRLDDRCVIENGELRI